MFLSQVLAEDILLIFDHKTTYIHIQALFAPSLPHAQLPSTSLLPDQQVSVLQQPTISIFSAEQEHSPLMLHLPQTKGWDVCVVYAIRFPFLKDQRFLLLFTQCMTITEPYILCSFTEVFSSRGSQAPVTILELKKKVPGVTSQMDNNYQQKRF